MVVIHVLIILFVSLYVIHNYIFRINIKKNLNQLIALFEYLLGIFPKKYRNILEQYFTFYNKLDANDKKRFEEKLLLFMASKEFIPRQIPEVTTDMRVLISACAVQLTFGLPNVTLKHFERILIYPDNYYSTINKVYHKGEVNPAFRIIVLSWKPFLEGYINPHDSLNLGLHEMAHALHLENIIRNGEHDFFDSRLLSKFDEIAIEACKNINHPANGFFRNSACYNTHEFFAVAVENFFERPLEMKERLPQVYQILSTLLKQEPASI